MRRRRAGREVEKGRRKGEERREEEGTGRDGRGRAKEWTRNWGSCRRNDIVE